jgi:hypothetical protein
MAIALRCPGCGKVYRLADDRAGRQAKCPCGAVMKVPAGASQDGPAWEDEVNDAFGPSPASEPQEPEPRDAIGRPAPNQGVQPLRSAPPKKPAATMPPGAAMPSREPHSPSDPSPREKTRAAGPPSALSSWVAGIAKIELRRLVKQEPWRAVFGLAAVAYGVGAAAAVLSGMSPTFLAGPSLGSLYDLLFGDTASRLAQAGLAIAIAVGGLLILKRDQQGLVCAGLAAALHCFFPMWGLLPGLRDAIGTERFAPFVLLAAEYAVPIALMVWCLKEQTRRQGWKKPS